MSMDNPSSGESRAKNTPAWAYVWWLATGTAFGFGIVSLLTVGALLVLLALVLGLVGARLPATRGHAAILSAAGIAVPILYIAWLNRGGPGRVCHGTTQALSCVDEWSPWPFVAAAVVVVVGAVAGMLVARTSAGKDRRR